MPIVLCTLSCIGIGVRESRLKLRGRRLLTDAALERLFSLSPRSDGRPAAAVLTRRLLEEGGGDQVHTETVGHD